MSEHHEVEHDGENAHSCRRQQELALEQHLNEQLLLEQHLLEQLWSPCVDSQPERYRVGPTQTDPWQYGGGKKIQIYTETKFNTQTEPRK